MIGEQVVSIPIGFAIDLDDSALEDEEVEPKELLNDNELCELLKVNSNKCIKHMILYRMIYMLLVRPILAFDIKHLEAEFAHGYHGGASVFYVSICNECGEERSIFLEDMKGWNKHWRNKNSLFKSWLLNSPHLK